MAKIKEIVDNARTLATAQGNIASFLYGYREDFNEQRDPTAFPLLMLQKFIDGNSIDEWKVGQGKNQTWNVTLFMVDSYAQGDNIEAIQETMQDTIEEFMESFVASYQSRTVSVAISYIDRFDDDNRCGVRYQFNIIQNECFGN